MTTEYAEDVPDTGQLLRYPTLRELVDAALAQSATLAAEPTRVCPHYAVPCEDLNGTPHQLVVVALGGRVALAMCGISHAAAVVRVPAGAPSTSLIRQIYLMVSSYTARCLPGPL